LVVIWKSTKLLLCHDEQSIAQSGFHLALLQYFGGPHEHLGDEVCLSQRTIGFFFCLVTFETVVQLRPVFVRLSLAFVQLSRAFVELQKCIETRLAFYQSFVAAETIKDWVKLRAESFP
jgi:hypothetical protein